MAKKQTQGQVLEAWRGELEMSVTDFCAALGVSRQWYYDRLKAKKDILDLKTLSELAVDFIDEWKGTLAVALIRMIDERFVPCMCQTEVGDAGPCPRHGKVEGSMLKVAGLEAEAVV